MYHRIPLPLEGSPAAEVALLPTAAVARRFGASLGAQIPIGLVRLRRQEAP